VETVISKGRDERFQEILSMEEIMLSFQQVIREAEV